MTSSPFRVEFTWANSYGRRRTVVVWANGSTGPHAVKAARQQINEVYGITRATLVSARPDPTRDCLV